MTGMTEIMTRRGERYFMTGITIQYLSLIGDRSNELLGAMWGSGEQKLQVAVHPLYAHQQSCNCVSSLPSYWLRLTQCKYAVLANVTYCNIIDELVG